MQKDFFIYNIDFIPSQIMENRRIPFPLNIALFLLRLAYSRQIQADNLVQHSDTPNMMGNQMELRDVRPETQIPRSNRGRATHRSHGNKAR